MPVRRSLISLPDLSRRDLERLWLASAGWKEDGVRRRSRRREARVATVFESPTVRTRLALDTAIHAVGAHRVDLPLVLGEREPVEDTAAMLSGAVDAVVVRTPDEDRLTALAAACQAPVVNAMTDRTHPCEVLAEAFSLLERGRLLDGLHVVAVGAATNVVRSWMELTVQVDLTVTQVCPPGHEVDQPFRQALADRAPRGRVNVHHDLREAAEQADVLYVDSWPPAARTPGRRRTSFSRTQVTTEVLDRAGPEVLMLHAMPVRRGEEVTAEAFADPRCVAVTAQRNLAPTYAAVLERALGLQP